jgi:hypothetical protein
MPTAPIDLLAFADDAESDAWRQACIAGSSASSDPLLALRIARPWRSDALLPGLAADPLTDELLPEGLTDDRARLWECRGGMVALGLQGDLLRPAWRHRRSGRIIPEPAIEDRSRTNAHRIRLERDCEQRPILSPEESGENLRIIVQELFARGVAVVLLVNCFRHAGGVWSDRPIGMPSGGSLRAQRFNQTAVAVSHETGAYVVDADQALGAVGFRALRRPGGVSHARMSHHLAMEMLRTLYRGGPLDNFIDDAAGREPIVDGDDLCVGSATA